MPSFNQSLPQVSLYIRIADATGRRYERLNRRNPQTGGVYCLSLARVGEPVVFSVLSD
jgi:hypothetical protein